MKVYCENCKWYALYINPSKKDNCNHPSNLIKKENYQKIWFENKFKPSELNFNNNCNNFEKKPWYLK